MDNDLQPARIIPPGATIAAEIRARGWTQRDLAEMTGRPEQAISEIVHGKKEITADTALELSSAFGTSAEFWMNLEARYRLQLARKQVEKQQNIERDARLRSLLPYSEALKRGWLHVCETITEREAEVCRFRGVSSLEDDPGVALAARRSAQGQAQVVAVTAWACRVLRLAEQQRVPPYSRDALSAAIPTLLACAREPADVARAPGILRAAGVHFLIVPYLQQTTLDGALLYCGEHPVVALTLRLKRLDNFWFTLLHELAHVVAGHRGHFLDSLYDNERTMTPEELEADALARDWLVPPEAYATVLGASGLTKTQLQALAADIGRHPSIVAGRVQHDTGNYRRFADLHVPVADFLAPWKDVAEPAAA